MPIPARYEIKYLLLPEQVPAVRAAIAGICALDAHSEEAVDRRYSVTSLYFDTPDLAFYRAKIDRAPRRLKLRARRYDSAGSPVFLEVKRRDGEVVRKTRAVCAGDWAGLLAAPREIVSRGDPALHDFSAMLEQTKAEPRLLVRYRREAWASVIDDYARVTFDSAIEYQPWDEASFDGSAGAWLPLDDVVTANLARSGIVLELKFDAAGRFGDDDRSSGRAPPWMISLVRRFDLLRRGFSKYGAGVDQLWARERPYDRWLKQARHGSGP